VATLAPFALSGNSGIAWRENRFGERMLPIDSILGRRQKTLVGTQQIMNLIAGCERK